MATFVSASGGDAIIPLSKQHPGAALPILSLILSSISVPFLRPKALATDISSDFEFIKHALDYIAKTEELPEYIIHLSSSSLGSLLIYI